MMTYESPIEVISRQFRLEQENGILKAVQEYGINVNKEELEKALRYDRDQYRKGYADGVEDGYQRKASEVAREIFEEIIEALADEQITEAQKASAALEAQDTLSYEVFNYAEDKLGTIVLALSLCKKKYSEGCDV